MDIQYRLDRHGVPEALPPCDGCPYIGMDDIYYEFRCFRGGRPCPGEEQAKKEETNHEEERVSGGEGQNHDQRNEHGMEPEKKQIGERVRNPGQPDIRNDHLQERNGERRLQPWVGKKNRQGR